MYVKNNKSIIKCHFNMPKIKATRVKDSQGNGISKAECLKCKGSLDAAFTH